MSPVSPAADLGARHRRRPRRVRRRRPDLAPEGVPARRGPGRAEPAGARPRTGRSSTPDGPPPVVRTYTPRRYDPATKTLEIQFLLHGTGPASEWAQRAKPGDKLAVAGPGGRFSLEPARRPLVARRRRVRDPGRRHAARRAAGDDCGRGAHRGRRPGRRGRVRPPRRRPRSPGTTGAPGRVRRRARSRPPARRASRTAPGSGWPARRPRCATSAATSPVDAPPAAASLVTRGYWRAGEQNHPDHDYGED